MQNLQPRHLHIEQCETPKSAEQKSSHVSNCVSPATVEKHGGPREQNSQPCHGRGRKMHQAEWVRAVGWRGHGGACLALHLHR